MKLTGSDSPLDYAIAVFLVAHCEKCDGARNGAVAIYCPACDALRCRIKLYEQARIPAELRR